MILLVRKALGFIGGILSPFFFVATAFAVGGPVPITPPPGSIGEICLTKIPQFIIQLIFVIGVVVAIAFLIYGGIRWILSGGDKTAIETARNHIVAAIVGLVVVVGTFFLIGILFQLLGQPNPITNLRIENLKGEALTCP